MKNFKHHLFLSLSIALILSLSACQKEEGPSSVPDIPENSVAQIESQDLSQAEESKELDNTKESKEPSEKESHPEEETSLSQESTEASKESENPKEEAGQDSSKERKRILERILPRQRQVLLLRPPPARHRPQSLQKSPVPLPA